MKQPAGPAYSTPRGRAHRASRCRGDYRRHGRRHGRRVACGTLLLYRLYPEIGWPAAVIGVPWLLGWLAILGYLALERPAAGLLAAVLWTLGTIGAHHVGEVDWFLSVALAPIFLAVVAITVRSFR